VPTRRLLAALWVLVLGVFAIGIGTALSRSGDDADSSPRAQPGTPGPLASGAAPSGTASQEPSAAPSETPSEQPTATPSPSVSPTSTATTGSGSGSGSGGGGTPGAPNMPNTGVPADLAAYAVLVASAGALATRAARS